MIKKITLLLLWIGFISYAFLLAPPDSPETFVLIKNLSLGKWIGINPLVISLFNIMGVLPLMYACVLLADGRGQKIKSTPFVLGTFALGAFVLLPYLALRDPNPQFTGKKDLLLKIADSRLLGIFLTLATIILLVFGFSQGNWTNFIEQWQTSRFIHVMSLDFCLLCLLFATILPDDLARRNIKNNLIFWSITLIPLFGPLVYLCMRPSLKENQDVRSSIKPA